MIVAARTKSANLLAQANGGTVLHAISDATASVILFLCESGADVNGKNAVCVRARFTHRVTTALRGRDGCERGMKSK